MTVFNRLDESLGKYEEIIIANNTNDTNSKQINDFKQEALSVQVVRGEYKLLREQAEDYLSSHDYYTALNIYRDIGLIALGACDFTTCREATGLMYDCLKECREYNGVSSDNLSHQLENVYNTQESMNFWSNLPSNDNITAHDITLVRNYINSKYDSINKELSKYDR